MDPKIRAMHMQTALVRFCARYTPFDFKQGHAGDFLIDAMWLAEQEPRTVRWIVVRELGTAMFEKLKDAKDHSAWCGTERAILRVKIHNREPDGL